MKIIFTGGGTAGHIFPIVAIIREIKEKEPNNFQFFYIGPKDNFAEKILKKEGVEIKTILAGKIRRYFSFKNIIDIVFKLPIGFFQAFYHIFVISPDLVFSKGGYGSIPTVIVSWILRTPIFIHESDAIPGLANKIASHFALEIFTAFPAEKTEFFLRKKIISIGNPLRKEILRKKGKPQEIFHLSKEKPIILFLGGSQGAQIINDKLLLVLPEFLKSFEIIHQTGKNNFTAVKRESDVVTPPELKKYYHPFPFLNEEEILTAYQAADLIVSRAGAGSIFEIAAIGKPSLLIPLENSAQDHQVKNAYIFAEAGAAIVIEEENLLPHFLLGQIKELFNAPQRLKEMAEKAKEFSRPEAAKIIAEYIIAYLKK